MGRDGLDGRRGDDESLQTVNITDNQGHEGDAVSVSETLLSPHVLSIFNRNASVPGQHQARNYLR